MINLLKKSYSRIIGAIVLLLVFILAATLEYFGLPGVQYFAVLVVLGMALELYIGVRRRIAREKKESKISQLRFNYTTQIGAGLMMLAASAWFVGAFPMVMLMLLVIIAMADIGGWFFGMLLKTEKDNRLWEKISPKKTWTGQIGGIICGTLAAIIFGLFAYGIFIPELIWIGISVSLLSQYGDLTASWIKRKLGLKDYGNIFPGHGGFMDRFDGWIFVLPIVAIWMMF
ncbi:MAG: phosphatidate cytidylyltransferase [Alphaproteobacteria bacterium]|nr:phosphatidate cytidylyltransferase [Alphaproteobacteria bacterium]